jgi:hypothetical protein
MPTTRRGFGRSRAESSTGGGSAAAGEGRFRRLLLRAWSRGRVIFRSPARRDERASSNAPHPHVRAGRWRRPGPAVPARVTAWADRR